MNPTCNPWIDITPGIRRQTITTGKTMYQMIAELKAGSRLPVHQHPQDQITHVIRGMDLLGSTGRQIQLARLLGRETPARFLHHPLVMKSPGQKLSKSDGVTGIREFRVSGRQPSEVLDLAARSTSALRT